METLTRGTKNSDPRIRPGGRVESLADIEIDLGDRIRVIPHGTAGKAIRPVAGGVLVRFFGDDEPAGVPLRCLRFIEPGRVQAGEDWTI